jgi:uncharacterized protein (AIM24 family)
VAPAPILKATTAQSETFAGVTYHVDGELVPVLTTELSGVPIYFEHHILLWKDAQTQIGVKRRTDRGALRSAAMARVTFLRCT